MMILLTILQIYGLFSTCIQMYIKFDEIYILYLIIPFICVSYTQPLSIFHVTFSAPT